MREYKFRAWDKKDKEMISEKDILAFYPRSKTIEILGKKFVRCYTEYTQMHEEHESDVVLMMSTGICDKNVKEIYEGDILRFTHEREDFINTDARIAVEIPKIYYMIDNPYNHSFEVIGNIYENPELLKEDSNDRKNLQKQIHGNM